jgi:hypothetical protein
MVTIVDGMNPSVTFSDQIFARVQDEGTRALMRRQATVETWSAVYTENSDSGVLVVQSAKDRMRYDASRVMNRA